MNFIDDLEQALKKHRNPAYAVLMSNYMKNNFPFLGIKSEERRSILKNILPNYKDQIKTDFRQIVWELYNKTEREFHYCAMDIIEKEIKKKFVANDIDFIEKLITTNSWWDSVDFFAKQLLGGYLQQFPEKTFSVIETFSNHTNMWLNRSAILFQLGYKAKTDFDILKSECEKHKESTGFFIQKAIGWALREYGKFNPNGVKEYVLSTNLKPLSHREALRNILKK
jgi:3-methyladenine DNA glycosylase AlkD